MFEIDLDEVLAAPTKMRSEVSEAETDSTNDFDFDGLEFEDHEEEFIENETDEALAPSTSSELKIISDADAQKGAEMAIDLIDTVNQFTLTPLAKWKLTKKLGGKKVIKKFQEVFEKELQGEELTKKEKEFAWKYSSYLKDKEEISNVIPFSEDEREKLTKSMADYFKKKNINFSGQGSFWAEFAMIEGMKIAQVLTM